MRKRLCALLAAGLLLLGGCGQKPEPVEGSVFAMDTLMSYTLYGEEEPSRAVGLEIPRQLETLESLLSATREESDVVRINRAGGEPVELDGCTEELLSQALELCRMTGGALDITAYPAVKAWGFTAGEHRIPSPSRLEELAGQIDYAAVGLEGNRVTLPAGMELDLGAVAKGYAGDWLNRIVRDAGVTSALLDLGQSTTVAVGSKPGTCFAVVELQDMAMGTSGGYQRYFEQDGVVYWHILDPKTAAPARSGLASVTVVAPSALTCDGLSTALFVMGLEEGARFWRDHPELEFEAVFVTETGEIFRTAGLEGRFSLAAGYEKREVTVLE